MLRKNAMIFKSKIIDGHQGWGVGEYDDYTIECNILS